MIKCYHFCSNDFLDKLLREGIIQADSDLRLLDDEPASYVKEYAFAKKKLNNGDGMFFAWSNPYYKGDTVFDENGSYALLELNIEDENIAILTNYENWCSFGNDIFDADGDLELADKICKEEYNMKNGLTDSYKYIFDTSEELDEVQVLLPYINKDWVQSVRKCMAKRL